MSTTVSTQTGPFTPPPAPKKPHKAISRLPLLFLNQERVPVMTKLVWRRTKIRVRRRNPQEDALVAMLKRVNLNAPSPQPSAPACKRTFEKMETEDSGVDSPSRKKRC